MESSETAGIVRIRRLVPDQWAVLRQIRLAALADADLPDHWEGQMVRRLC